MWVTQHILPVSWPSTTDVNNFGWNKPSSCNFSGSWDKVAENNNFCGGGLDVCKLCTVNGGALLYCEASGKRILLILIYCELFIFTKMYQILWYKSIFTYKKKSKAEWKLLLGNLIAILSEIIIYHWC